MDSPYATWTPSQLIATWQDSACSRHEREETTWEYWSRVADGDLEFDRDVFDVAVRTPNELFAEGMGRLLVLDRLPHDLFPVVLSVLPTFEASRADWLGRTLEARAAIAALRFGEGDRGHLLEYVTRKGVHWAALEAVALLEDSERTSLVERAERVRCFTRSQLRQLRDVCRRSPER